MCVLLVEDEVPCDAVDHWDVYVVLLWGVCVLLGDVTHEKEEEKVLDQPLSLLLVLGDSHFGLQ